MDNVGSAENIQAGGEDSQDKVSRETYLKTLDEVKKVKAKNKELEAFKQSLEEEKLKEQNQWKQYAEQQAKKAEEALAQVNQYESLIEESIKFNAFQNALGGKLKHDSYRSFIPLDKVVFNPETKQVDQDSLKTVVGQFTKEHPSLIDFGSGKMPNVASKDAHFGPKDPRHMSKEELEAELRKIGKI